ncbi:MATE family efflux transporter [Dubosiella newyorkensis]|uniref:MATE family efflux transporter n=1 Tax=Dubosiella newyorkensis TaxID=1862672 RepID=UPI0032B2689B
MSENQNTMDMTSGPCAKQILVFGTPLLAGNLLQQLYNFVDTIVVGRGIGVDALAAVGLTGSLNFLVLGFVIGLSQGVSILVSQYFGARDPQSIRRSITMSFFLCFGFSIIITFLAFFGTEWLLRWIQTPEDLMANAKLYIQIIFACMSVSMCYNFYSGILRAFGDSKNPLIAMILSFFLNTILDIVLVIPCKMGVAGAAIATVVAQLFSAIYCFTFVQRIQEAKIKKEDWKWNPYLFFRSLKLSIPVAIMNSITAVGVMVLQSAINQFGSIYIAGYTAASKVIILLEQIPSTYGFATGTFVGQNLGANHLGRIKKGVKSMNITMALMCLACCVLIFLFGEFIMKIMIGENEHETMLIGFHCLKILSLFLVGLGWLWIFRCALQSMGDTFWPMISGIVELVARIGMVALLPVFLSFDGILLAEVSAWVAAACMLAIVYWITIRKLDQSHLLMERLPLEV